MESTDRIRGARYGAGCGVVFGKTEMRQEKRRRKDEQFTIIDWLLTSGILLLLLLIGGMIGYAARAYAGTPEPRRDIHAAAQIPAAEKRWIEQRHKHHGISGSIEENGEHYFYRGGKKCKL